MQTFILSSFNFAPGNPHQPVTLVGPWGVNQGAGNQFAMGNYPPIIPGDITTLPSLTTAQNNGGTFPTNSVGFASFISPQLAAKVVSAGTWQFGIAGSNAGGSQFAIPIPIMWIGVINASTGAVTSLGSLKELNTSWPHGQAVTGSGPSGGFAASGFTLNAGDYLVCEIGYLPSASNVIAAAINVFTDGTTPALDGQVFSLGTSPLAFLSAPVDLPLQTPIPNTIAMPQFGAAVRGTLVG